MQSKYIYIDGIKTQYTVDEYGNVYSFRLKDYLNHFPDKDGYMRVNIYYKPRVMKTMRVHRLVAMAFCQNPNNDNIVNHIDGNILNNHYTNLEWCTTQWNTQHAVRLGLIKYHPHHNHPKGEKHALSKLSLNQANEIIDMIMGGFSCTEIGLVLQIDRKLVYGIRHRKSWVHLTKDLEFPPTPRKYPNTLKLEITNLLRQNHTAKEIFEILNLPKNNTTVDIIKRLRKKLINN